MERPLTPHERTALRVHAHRHALLLSGHLEALPPERADAATASVRQLAVILETLSDNHRLALADYHAALRRQVREGRIAFGASLAALVLALITLAV